MNKEDIIKQIQERLAREEDSLCAEYLRQTGEGIRNIVLCHQLGKDNVYRIWIERK